VAALISLDEYLRTSYHPECDFIKGGVLERTAMQDRVDDYLQFGVPNV
jgi:hypothetical protein